jgi:hypothetical protein
MHRRCDLEGVEDSRVIWMGAQEFGMLYIPRGARGKLRSGGWEQGRTQAQS